MPLAPSGRPTGLAPVPPMSSLTNQGVRLPSRPIFHTPPSASPESDSPANVSVTYRLPRLSNASELGMPIASVPGSIVASPVLRSNRHTPVVALPGELTPA